MIRIESVSRRFGHRVVLNAVSLEVPKGTVCSIIGPSGSGKSTLLRCVNFLEPYDDGAIYIDDKLVGYTDGNGSRVRRKASEIAQMRSEATMVFQQMNLFSHLTALENVAVAPIKVKKMRRADAEEKAKELLSKVGLAERMHDYPGHLSGGEQQRVAIARALAMDPKVLLLDEVTSALDPERVSEVLAVIEKLAREGITMLVVTHEMDFARRASQQVVFLEDGCVIERGGPEILTSASTPRVTRFLDHLRQPPKNNVVHQS